MNILRCMASRFYVKFQRAPLKLHTKFWTHTPQSMHFTNFCFWVWFTIYFNYDVISLSELGPSVPISRLHQSQVYAMQDIDIPEGSIAYVKNRNYFGSGCHPISFSLLLHVHLIFSMSCRTCTVGALLWCCIIKVWPHSPRLFQWRCSNTTAPVSPKQLWWIYVNRSYKQPETTQPMIMNK